MATRKMHVLAQMHLTTANQLIEHAKQFYRCYIDQWCNWQHDSLQNCWFRFKSWLICLSNVNNVKGKSNERIRD